MCACVFRSDYVLKYVCMHWLYVLQTLLGSEQENSESELDTSEEGNDDPTVPDLGESLVRKLKQEIQEGGGSLYDAISRLSDDHGLTSKQKKTLKAFNMADWGNRAREIKHTIREVLSEHPQQTQFRKLILKLNSWDNEDKLRQNVMSAKLPDHALYLVLDKHFERKANKLQRLLTMLEWPADDIQSALDEIMADNKEADKALKYDSAVMGDHNELADHLMQCMQDDLKPKERGVLTKASFKQNYLRNTVARAEAMRRATAQKRSICHSFQTRNCNLQPEECPDLHKCIFCKDQSHCGRDCTKLVPRSMRFWGSKKKQNQKQTPNKKTTK